MSAELQRLLREAMQLHRNGAVEQAAALYREILASSPGNPDALHLYGLTCRQLGRHDEAVEYISKAVEQVPDQPVLRNNLAEAMFAAGDAEGAIRQLHEALELRPSYAGAHQNLGSVHYQMGAHDAALEHSRKAIEMDQGAASAWFNLGLVRLDHVDLEKARDAFREALHLQPGHVRAATSLLYVLNLLPGTRAEEVAAETRRVTTRLFADVSPGREFPSPGDRIRIGYVSADFREHAVSYFFEPILRNHDPARFETWCYSDVTDTDAVTKRLRSAANHWRDINGRSDAAVARQIRSDEIDVLVDLGGHTRQNRLGVFARKPAARQVSYLGFPATTGLAAMDYRIVDSVTAPPGATFHGSERPLRPRPGFACFRPPAGAPAVTAPPCSDRGQATFGSLHKLEKLNGDVISLWAQILQQNPGTRLLLARDRLDDWQQQRLAVAFGAHGIRRERLAFSRIEHPRQNFLQLFAQIDVLLDTFPWSGHTLACCALWMGVPVITLCGDRHAGRMTASVLHALGLDELVAPDTGAYARIAGELGADHGRLQRYRQALRPRFEASTLRDEAGFTRELEELLIRICR
jgi:predicted O-linked N-acetylglucosamine transferase (SPINDLY family)